MIKKEDIKKGVKVKLLGNHVYGDYDNIEDFYRFALLQGCCKSFFMKKGYGIIVDCRNIEHGFVRVGCDKCGPKNLGCHFNLKDLELYEDDTNPQQEIKPKENKIQSLQEKIDSLKQQLKEAEKELIKEEEKNKYSCLVGKVITFTLNPSSYVTSKTIGYIESYNSSNNELVIRTIEKEEDKKSVTFTFDSTVTLKPDSLNYHNVKIIDDNSFSLMCGSFVLNTAKSKTSNDTRF